VSTLPALNHSAHIHVVPSVGGLCEIVWELFDTPTYTERQANHSKWLQYLVHLLFVWTLYSLLYYLFIIECRNLLVETN